MSGIQEDDRKIGQNMIHLSDLKDYGGIYNKI